MRTRQSYRFGYRWQIRGPIDTVFHYVSDARTFHEWFDVFKEVRADDPTGPVHVGSHTHCTVKALLPYVLDWDITVSQLEPPNFLQTEVHLTLNGRFQMNGYVRYRLEQEGPIVTVINEQELIPERPLPWCLSPLAQAAFTFNHHWAMGRAQERLQHVVSQRAANSADHPGP